jgi:hypothetical protein
MTMRWTSLIVALALAAACSPSKKTPAAPTKAPAAPAPAADAPKPAAMASPNKPSETEVKGGDARHEDDDVLAQLVGIWRVDLDALAKDPAITNLPEKERPEALALMRQTFQSMAFEYAADGKLRVFLGSQTRTGTYTIDGSEEDAVSVTTVLGTGANKIESKIKITFSGTAALITQNGEPSLRLVRGIPAPPGAPSKPAAP